MTRYRAVREDRPGCPAPIHDTRSARERQRCSCPAAELDSFRSRKRRGLTSTQPKLVPAIGVTRRLQALAAIDWSSADVARHLGVTAGHVRHLRRGRCLTVERWVADRVTAAYPLLVRTPPPRLRPPDRARLHAAVAAGRWQPPAAWTGVDIDDPAAAPRIRLALGHRTLALAASA